MATVQVDKNIMFMIILRDFIFSY